VLRGVGVQMCRPFLINAPLLHAKRPPRSGYVLTD
jgi:hypothetical protein